MNTACRIQEKVRSKLGKDHKQSTKNKNERSIWDDWVGDSSDDDDDTAEKETKPIKDELDKESGSIEQTMEFALPDHDQQVVDKVDDKQEVEISLPQQNYQATTMPATSVKNHPKATNSLKICSLPSQMSFEGTHA